MSLNTLLYHWQRNGQQCSYLVGDRLSVCFGWVGWWRAWAKICVGEKYTTFLCYFVLYCKKGTSPKSCRRWSYPLFLVIMSQALAHHGFLYLDEQLLNMTCPW